MRSGIGFDAHAFSHGRALVLGGVRIPHARGLAGHSDGDVLTHAIIDSLLGAAGLGDIGEMFPSDDPVLSGIASIELLRRVGGLVSQSDASVVSVDAVVIAEAPGIASYRDVIVKTVSEAMGVPPGCLGVKGTTTDGMGFTGRGEGIAAMAVALLG